MKESMRSQIPYKESVSSHLFLSRSSCMKQWKRLHSISDFSRVLKAAESGCQSFVLPSLPIVYSAFGWSWLIMVFCWQEKVGPIPIGMYNFSWEEGQSDSPQRIIAASYLHLSNNNHEGGRQRCASLGFGKVKYLCPGVTNHEECLCRTVH